MEKIRNASLYDTVKFNLFHIVPYLLRGIFTKNRFWCVLFDTIHPDPLAVKFCQRLRAKYQTGFISTYLIRNKSLLVFDPDGIRHVLDNSPLIYADPDLKRMGMSPFSAQRVNHLSGRRVEGPSTTPRIEDALGTKLRIIRLLGRVAIVLNVKIPAQEIVFGSESGERGYLVNDPCGWIDACASCPSASRPASRRATL